MKKILCVFGTRPEFIKVYPLILELSSEFNVDSVNTGQHVELLNPIMGQFSFQPTYTLSTMEQGQTLNKLSSKILTQIDELVCKYDAVVVQGDTTTAMMVALAAFNRQVKVIHIEAGLRSNDKQNPFPEEINRRIISEISDFNFCPNDSDLVNLKHVITTRNYVVGNTVTDMLRITSNINSDILRELNVCGKYVLVTCHRRENHSKIDEILDAIEYISKEQKIIFSVHKNPSIYSKIHDKFKTYKNVVLVDGFGYVDMVTVLKNCEYVISDSGGVQEAAPSFNKFVYVMRETTERMESVTLGMSKLVGNSFDNIVKSVSEHTNLINVTNPYGDGYVSKRIVEILKNEL